MKKISRIWIAALAVVVAISAVAFSQDDAKKDVKEPKHTIKQVMAKTMAPKGDKLYKKVLSGKATEEEKQELLDLFLSLTENKPPAGDEASWQTFSDAAVVAAAKVVVGRDGAIVELKTATNCKKCHDAHKPSKKQPSLATNSSPTQPGCFSRPPFIDYTTLVLDQFCRELIRR